MSNVVHQRLERLACGFDLSDNYFAWQAFGRRYATGRPGPLPPYLLPENFDKLRSRIGDVDVRHRSFTEHLASKEEASLDAFVLLDAQDWMTEEILNDLWAEIERTARPGARVIFRTAGEESILPGRLPDSILSKFIYDAEKCRALTAKDRSSIYGGFHLYVYKPAEAAA
jgi:S-adenosylmethionine-diacylglycerol 3-amino-3-carboxypropyl transferase